MAEFSLVFPAILLLVLAVMQMALIANAQYVLNYAAYAAVRAAVVQPDPASQNIMRLAATLICTPLDPLTFMKIRIDKAQKKGAILEAEISFHYHLLIPGVGALVRTFDKSLAPDEPSSFPGGPHIRLHSRCAMLIESPGP